MHRFKGYILAALAAAAYGTNPAFAVPLYSEGMNPNSVLLFRYIMGLPLLAIIMKCRGLDLSLNRREIFPVAILGILMAYSSLTLFKSYEYMNSGIASTLLFVYPVLVAVLMIAFFHEKFKISIALCLVIMCFGLYMLMNPGEGTSLSGYGCLLVMISALTYALYIIIVNISKPIRNIPTTKLLFHVLMWGSLVFILMIPAGNDLILPGGGFSWLNLVALAVIPTVISLSFTTRAIQLIGSTPTAILGALEPVSAVILSWTVLGQGLTGNDIAGGALIVLATTLVVADKSVDKAILHVRKMFPLRRK